MKYRLYIDEVGNSDLGSSTDPNNRYLNLTGVIIELGYVQDTVHPEMEALKQRFFSSHPDEPLIFHRRELSRRIHPFQALKDPVLNAEFDKALLECLKRWEYWVVSVTIDKLELKTRYTVWQYHPYHYCLHVLLERYVMFLEGVSHQGDVMAEARGGKEDQKLKASFTGIYENGTPYMDKARFQAALTSKELKLKQKSNNISGLQLADLLAYPSSKSIMASHQNQKQPTGFSGEIVQILADDKYLRNPKNGQTIGWGRKWLP